MWLSNELAENAHLINVPLSDYIRDVAKPAYDQWRHGKDDVDLAMALEEYSDRFTAKCRRLREEDPQAFKQTLASRRTQLEKFLKRNRHTLNLHFFLVTFAESERQPVTQFSEGMYEHMERACGSSQALAELLEGIQSSINLRARRDTQAALSGFRYISARDLRRELTTGLVTLIRNSAPEAARKLLKKQPTGVQTLPWSSLLSTLRNFGYIFTGWPSSALRYILDVHGVGGWYQSDQVSWRKAVGLTRPGSWQVEALRDVCNACKDASLAIQPVGDVGEAYTAANASSAVAPAPWMTSELAQSMYSARS
ncbi:unnamed protein product [Parajaminaea phylloscopi]